MLKRYGTFEHKEQRERLGEGWRRLDFMTLALALFGQASLSE
jgi:hypothetical protein